MKCVHCLKEFPKTTKDHVFPSSWYPDNTPGTVQRWTVPSCSICNEKLGELEKELFIRLAMCVDPTKAESSGISKSALRSLGVGVQDIDDKERAHRAALRDRIVAEIKPLSESGHLPLFPGLGLHQGFPVEQQKAIEISEAQLVTVSEKVLRGCEYKLSKKKYIEEPYRLKIYFAHDEGMENVTSSLTGIEPITLGPGFEVRRGQTPPVEGYMALYRVTIWGTVKIYASIAKEEDLEMR